MKLSNALSSLALLAFFGATSANACPAALVSDWTGNTVSFVDTASNSLIQTLSVSSNPGAGDVSPTGDLAMVSLPNANKVSLIDLQTRTQLAEISVGSTPVGVSFTLDGKFAWVANLNSNNVSIIDVKKRTVVATVAAGSGPHQITFSPDGLRAYIVNRFAGTLTVLNSQKRTLLKTIQVGANPVWSELNLLGDRLLVANTDSNNITVVNTASLTVDRTISSNGSYPRSILFSADGTKFFVVNHVSGALAVFDSSNYGFVTSITLGSAPQEIKMAPFARYAYVGTSASELKVVDTLLNQVSASVAVGGSNGGISLVGQSAGLSRTSLCY